MIDLWKLDYETVMTILEHYHDLSTGVSILSLGDNIGIIKTGNSHGPQEELGMLCATICQRVRRCGLDGMLTEERYGLNLLSSPKSEEQIAKERDIPIKDVYKSINRVTWYCCGRNGPLDENKHLMTYQQWRERKRYRRKDSTFVVH
jgi:hypothetical protein